MEETESLISKILYLLLETWDWDSRNQHTLNLIIMSGVVQCWILSLILIISKKGSRVANRFLSVLIIIISLFIFWIILFDWNLHTIKFPILKTPCFYILGIGPTLYFFSLYLTNNNYKFDKKDYCHFIPVVLEFFWQLKNILFEDYYLYYEFDYNSFWIITLIIWCIGITSVFIYLNKSQKLIALHKKWILENFASSKDITLTWLQKLFNYYKKLFFILSLNIFLLIVFFLFSLNFTIVYLSLYFLFITLIYYTYWFGIQSYIKIKQYPLSTFQPKENKNFGQLSASEINEYLNTFNQLMGNEKLFLTNTLSLKSLSNHLNLDPNLVSFIINKGLRKNFNDYVNGFRVEEVKRKLKDPKYAHLTILGIAFESGFNSKSAFNRIFKEITQKTPSQYQKEL